MKRFTSFALLVLALWTTGCAHRPDPRADFLKLIQRPRVPLSPQVEEISTNNGLVQWKFSFVSEPGQRVPACLLKLENSRDRRPAVIALHGTGGSKQNMLSLARKLATNGFVAVVIDGRYHGERTQVGFGTAEYYDAIARAWREGGEHPLYYDTVWDVRRLVDYLRTRTDVDSRRIGLLGISKGGIETYFAAATDKRIAAAVPIIGVQSFRWALEHGLWQGRIRTIQGAFDAVCKDAGVTHVTREFVQAFYDRVVPSIYSEFDGPTLLPWIAPRPLLVINSDSDPNTPLPGVLECAEAAKAAYHRAGADDRFALIIQEETAHQVKPESERATVAWFVKWLKP
jgi:dienelactone hydrolase